MDSSKDASSKSEKTVLQKVNRTTLAAPKILCPISGSYNMIGGMYHMATADVKFVFDVNGKEEYVPAHRFILTLHSPVFHQMFFGQLKECRNVKLNDTTVEAFVDFVKCFYNTLATINSSPLKISQLIYLAHKYDVNWLENKCIEIIDRAIDRDIRKVFWVLPLAVFFSYEKLVEKCMTKMRVYENSLMESTELNDSQKEDIKQQFADTDFYNPDEVEALEMHINSALGELELDNSGKAVIFLPPWVCDKFFQRSLLDDPITCDVAFVFQCTNDAKPKRILAHKCILASESPVFADIFNEHSSLDGTDIKVTIAPIEEFTVFLELIYTIYPCEKLMAIEKIDDRNIEGILALASKFKVSSLITPFELHLIQKLNRGNAIWHFQLAQKYSLKSPRTESVRVMNTYGARILASHEFLNCSHETLKHLLELNIWDSDLLIDACVKWAQNYCRTHQLDPDNWNDIQSALGDTLKMEALAAFDLHEKLC